MRDLTTFRDLLAGHSGATILCAFTGMAVRRLAVIDDDIVDLCFANGDKIGVPIDTPILYEPWFMDRGSLVFASDELPEHAKLCTEGDLIRFEDGTEIHAPGAVDSNQW